MDLLLIGLIIIIPLIAEIGVKGTYKKYLKVENKDGISGQEVARKILDKNGLKDMYVVEVEGELSDHYDPQRKVVRLSKNVFHGTTVASIAIAAHECGHAIQDKEGYLYMRFRSLICPVVNIATSFSYIIIMIGLVLGWLKLFYIGIACTMMGLLFQIVTLPVEFNASNRAKKQIEELRLASKDEQDGVKKVLLSAAFTYVAGVLASALQILRLVLASQRNRK